MRAPVEFSVHYRLIGIFHLIFCILFPEEIFIFGKKKAVLRLYSILMKLDKCWKAFD